MHGNRTLQVTFPLINSQVASQIALTNYAVKKSRHAATGSITPNRHSWWFVMEFDTF